jgi:hypothetical protein
MTADGRLADNVVLFARVLRAAGLPIGTGQALDAVRAVVAVGPGDRRDFHAALAATLTNRRDQRPVFDQAFHMFWRNPRLRERMMRMLLPEIDVESATPGETQAIDRVAEAMRAGLDRPPSEPRAEEIEVDAALTWSAREMLQVKDFEAMSIAELAEAKRAIRAMRHVFADVPTRRLVPDPRGRWLDGRASLRATARAGGDVIALNRRATGTRPPNVVVLCDISGSMERYARVLLHFVHGLTNDRARVFSFVFGTRLTNITRALRHRDVDVAVSRASGQVVDWSGGTRIGHCLADFNRLWSRRVLGGAATVLFISDGLDRDAGEAVGPEIARLHRSCRRLIWLNPLLRWEGFEPKSLGIRAILPHVDSFLPVHNLRSLEDLARILTAPDGGRHTIERRAA